MADDQEQPSEATSEAPVVADPASPTDADQQALAEDVALAGGPEALAAETGQSVEAIEAALVPRDETHDSIDPATGALTAEAQAKRREMNAAAAEAEGPAD